MPPAYAQGSDPADPALLAVVVCAGLIALACMLALLPVWLAWRRGSPRWEAIRVLAIVWVLVAAGSAIWMTASRMKWNHEQQIRIQSGYYDPADESDRPRRPWKLDAGLVGCYGAMLILAIRRPRR